MSTGLPDGGSSLATDRHGEPPRLTQSAKQTPSVVDTEASRSPQPASGRGIARLIFIRADVSTPP